MCGVILKCASNTCIKMVKIIQFTSGILFTSRIFKWSYKLLFIKLIFTNLMRLASSKIFTVDVMRKSLLHLMFIGN